MAKRMIKTLINDRKFECFQSSEVDNVLSVRLLSTLDGEAERTVEEMEKALEKAKAVYSVLFPKGKPDALVSESEKISFLCGGDQEPTEEDEALIEALGEMLETPIMNAMVKMRFMKEYEHPFETETVQIPDSCEGSRSVKLDRERAISWVGDKPCDPDQLFRWLIAGVCPKKVGLVSLDFDCVLVVDGERCHIVFADREAMEKGKAVLGI